MLGTEYNWLVTFSRLSGGVHQVSLARNGLLTLTVATFCLLCLALCAAPSG